MKTGRPVETDMARRLRAGEAVEHWPSDPRRQELAARLV